MSTTTIRPASFRGHQKREARQRAGTSALRYLPCPHCGGMTRGFKSLWQSTVTLEISMQCDNDQCGFRYVVLIEAERTIVLPSRLAPGYSHIPIDSSIDRAALIEALQKLPSAAPPITPG